MVRDRVNTGTVIIYVWSNKLLGPHISLLHINDSKILLTNQMYNVCIHRKGRIYQTFQHL
jgi:hypothetical protein